MKSIEIRTKDDIVICTPKDFTMLTPYVLFEKSDWYEPEIQFVREFIKPDMHFVDVGACFGVYSLMAANKVSDNGKVTAFENDLLARNFLELSIKTNKFENLSLNRKAVSNKIAAASWLSGSSPELSRLESNGQENIETITLDSWWTDEDKPAIDFIKIDINGDEQTVIEGASSLLNENDAILLISVEPNNLNDIKAVLNKQEYGLFEYLPGSGILTAFQETELNFKRNLIALTDSKANELKETGWVLNEELTYEVPDSQLWSSVFEDLPWTNSLMFGWDYMADMPENKTYFEALNYLIAAEKLVDSPDQNVETKSKITSYLIESVHRLIGLYNSGITNISMTFTLVRGLIALGKRDQAAHIMQQMIDATAFGQKNMDAPLPFLLPIKNHELTEINTEYSKWLMVRSIESWLLLQNDSTYWSGEQEQKIIDILEGNPEISTPIQNIHKIRAYSRNEDEEKEKPKSLLFITTDFPPYDEGRIGHSLRAHTLANFFAENGYDVYLVILAKMIADREAPYMHPNIQIINPLYHELKVTNDELSVPDFCADFMRKYSIPTLLTSSPPLTSSLFGLKIKKSLGDSIYWISDFRDFIHIHPLTRSKDEEGNLEQKGYELEVMQNADAVLNVSTGMTKIARDLHLEFDEQIDEAKFEIVENGFIEQEKVEPEDDVVAFAKKSKDEGRIVIYYAGTGSLIGVQQFEGVYKDLTFLFDVFQQNPKIAKNFALIIQGKIQVNIDYLKKLNTKLSFKFFDPVPNEVMQANLEVADVGLSVNSDKIATPYIMGGKLYDYANSGLALLLIYPDNPNSLQEFSSKHNDKCYFANVFEPESVKDVLSKIIIEKDNLEDRKFSSEEVKPYSRKEQYKKILALIEKGDNENSGGTFVHFCYNSVYAQTLADLLKFTNENTNQQHVLYVEQEQTVKHFSVDLEAYKDAFLFNKNTDSQWITNVITNDKVDAIFMHGIFRPWQFNIIEAIGEHKHVGWMVWGGDLYNPIKNGTTHAFPGHKISSLHTPLEGDINMFKKHYGDISTYDFGYLYPGLYGNINAENPNAPTKRIIIGNSGDQSNNHVEILQQLAVKKDIAEYKIILPVAYGFHDEYRKYLIHQIDELGLSEQVEFHTDFISPENYLQFVADADMMIMAHDRQQAMGNLLMALYLNKPAILRKTISTEGQLITNLGWSYLTDADLNPLSYEDFELIENISDIPVNDEETLAKNRASIHSYFGMEIRSKFLAESCQDIVESVSKGKQKAIA